MNAIREWAELAYFVSGVVLAIVAIFGLKQVWIMKKDMFVRMDRSAKEKAMEYATRYETTYVSLVDTFTDECKEKGLECYEGPITDFSRTSIPSEYVEKAKQRLALNSSLPAINELQVIASAFTSGVADDQTGFTIIGKTYCLTVRFNYDIISWCRIARACDYYQNIVDLYGVWAPRFDKAELEAERSHMDKCISCIPDKTIPPIGA